MKQPKGKSKCRLILDGVKFKGPVPSPRYGTPRNHGPVVPTMHQTALGLVTMGAFGGISGSVFNGNRNARQKRDRDED